ncbi:cysteine hydrolase [Candidatus Woesearchaeota archaeon]|nr:cysteine hydrolase [Candidatus Woesearchaeota archaeon]
MIKKLVLAGIAATGLILAGTSSRALTLDMYSLPYYGNQVEESYFWGFYPGVDIQDGICLHPEKQEAGALDQPLCFDRSLPQTSAPLRNLAVLLIDMQGIFLKNISPVERQEEIAYQSDVLDFCRQNNVPLYVLEYQGCGRTMPSLEDKYLQLRDVRRVIKMYDDGFWETNLAEQLHHSGIERLLLMGINASACVRSTAEGALEHGFAIMTSKQLIANPAEADWGYIESIPWFQEQGIYRDNYTELLGLLSEEMCQTE